MLLGKVLRSWRMHEELSGREAAKMLGISTRTLYRLERGDIIKADAMASIVTRLWKP